MGNRLLTTLALTVLVTPSTQSFSQTWQQPWQQRQQAQYYQAIQQAKVEFEREVDHLNDLDAQRAAILSAQPNPTAQSLDQAVTSIFQETHEISTAQNSLYQQTSIRGGETTRENDWYISKNRFLQGELNHVYAEQNAMRTANAGGSCEDRFVADARGDPELARKLAPQMCGAMNSTRTYLTDTAKGDFRGAANAERDLICGKGVRGPVCERKVARSHLNSKVDKLNIAINRGCISSGSAEIMYDRMKNDPNYDPPIPDIC